MSSVAISLIAFVIMSGGALLGMFLRTALPRHHLSDESRDVVKLATGLVGTMAALVLGLLVASAKGSYDAQTTELTQMSANIVVLDRTLAHYGPEAKETREALRNAVAGLLNQLGSKNRSGASRLEPAPVAREIVYDSIQALTPRNDLQHSVQPQALGIAVNLAQTRWLMYEQGAMSVSKPLLVVMVFWLNVTFVIWGLLAAPNGTLIATMLISALSASGGILLILEMYTPYGGLIQVSDAPLRAALAQLGQ
jgi:hypothetical protein